MFVRPETRERVERALAELDYVPNLGARGLRNGRYGLIALALPDLSTAYSAELAHHFVEEAHARGWSLQIEETAAEPAPRARLLSRARSHLVDGLVLNPVSLADSAVPGGRRVRCRRRCSSARWCRTAPTTSASTACRRRRT